MSDLQLSDEVVNNGERYGVRITNHSRQERVVIYEAQITDTAFMAAKTLHFRYTTMKKIHEAITNRIGQNKKIPEFPKTQSIFCLWNKTNNSLKLIAERKRQLQYYLTKILNTSFLQELPELHLIKSCLNKSNRKLSKSESKFDKRSTAYSLSYSQSPQFYKRKITLDQMLQAR